MSQLTAERVRSLLDYDPDTGMFTWKVYKGGAAKAGSPAGSIRKEGYRAIRIDGNNYYEHRLAWLYMTGEWPAHELDHRDRVGMNNRFNNLRSASTSQNQANRSLKSTNTSGYKGVHWQKSASKWKATLGVGGRLKHLGLFENAEDAHMAYAQAAAEAFGEFDRTV
jgi:hypothetical protein